MFNFGISELMVIAVVGLIVIGPERLPRVARTLGHLFGRMQRYVNDIKADINREVELDELRQLQSSMKEAAEEIEQSVSKQVNYVEGEVRAAEAETRKSVEDAVKPAAGIDLMGSSRSAGQSGKSGQGGESEQAEESGQGEESGHAGQKAQEDASTSGSDPAPEQAGGTPKQANSSSPVGDSQDKRA